MTVVSVAVCTTVHPIGSRTSLAKRASPWRDEDPIEVSVQEVPVMAATASGYVALDASDSIVKTPDSGTVYTPRGILYTLRGAPVSGSRSRVTWMPKSCMRAMVMSM